MEDDQARRRVVKETRDWNKYKKAGNKRKLEEASKDSGNIQNMFKKQSVKATRKDDIDNENNKNSPLQCHE